MSDRETDARHPYGYCECENKIGCCHGMGPAAHEVTRDGKRLRLCTRCDLNSDLDKVLLVTEEDRGDVFFDFDPLGGFLIIAALAERKKSVSA